MRNARRTRLAEDEAAEVVAAISIVQAGMQQVERVAGAAELAHDRSGKAMRTAAGLAAAAILILFCSIRRIRDDRRSDR